MNKIYEAYINVLTEKKYTPRYTDKDLAKWGSDEIGLKRSETKDWVKTMDDEDRKAHEDEMEANDITGIAYEKYRKYLIGLCKKHKVKYTASNDNYDLGLMLAKAGIEVK